LHRANLSVTTPPAEPDPTRADSFTKLGPDPSSGDHVQSGPQLADEHGALLEALQAEAGMRAVGVIRCASWRRLPALARHGGRATSALGGAAIRAMPTARPRSCPG
jgi:hypothetical protein